MPQSKYFGRRKIRLWVFSLKEMPPKFKRTTEKEDRVLLLGSDDDSDDDEPTAGSHPSRKPRYSSRTYDEAGTPIKRVQNQVSEVIDVMRDNIGKVLERGEKLSELEVKSEDLADSATQFRYHSTKLQKKMWWQNCKLKLLLLVIVLVIVIAILAPLIASYVKNRNSDD